MAETRPYRKTQLRAACDLCSAAKVRCDKVRPSCIRCVQNNVHCCYSESRRHGRPSWHKRTPMKRQGAPSGAVLDEPHLTRIHVDQGRIFPTQGMQSPLLTNDLNIPLPLSFGNSIDTTFIQPGTFEPHADISDLANWSPAEPDRILSAGLGTNNLPVIDQSLGDELQNGSSITRDVPSVPTTTSKHDCEARAISILGSMQHGEMRRGLMSCATDPSDAYASLELTPSFDRVIAVNQAALSGWKELMRCSCAQCPHLILLYVSVLSKMLFWYRIAATQSQSSDDTLEYESSTAFIDLGNLSACNKRIPTTEESPTVDRFKVRPTTIQIGNLNLDEDSQANLRSVILLRELRNTENAIQALKDVDRKSIINKAEEAVRSTVEWAISLVTSSSSHFENAFFTLSAAFSGYPEGMTLGGFTVGSPAIHATGVSPFPRKLALSSNT